MRSALVLLFTLTVAAPALAGEWRQFLDEDGVKGYSRRVAGSDILEMRSTIVVPARIEVVGAVLRDIEGLARPGTSCTEARVVDRRDRDHYSFYVAYRFPWPASDRDAVIQVVNRYDLDRARVISDLRAIEHPRVPRRKGFVRITDISTQFVIEYITRQRTGVIYTSRMDPGGHIPAWMVNRGARSSLRSNAVDLRRATTKPEYLRAASSSSDAALVEQLTRDPQRMRRIMRNRLGEFIRDRAMVETLMADARVLGSLPGGSGQGASVGEVLMHGWGSRESQRQAVKMLLRRLLWGVTRDGAAIEGLLADPQLLDRILLGQRGHEKVMAFINRYRPPRAESEKSTKR